MIIRDLFFGKLFNKTEDIERNITKMFIPSCKTIKCDSVYKKFLNFVNYSIYLDNERIVDSDDVVSTTIAKFKDYAERSVYSDRLKYVEGYSQYDKIIYCNVSMR